MLAGSKVWRLSDALVGDLEQDVGVKWGFMADKREILEAAKCDLLHHPAVKAWVGLHPTQFEPTRIVVLKPEKKRSAVYRLENSSANPSVIAKRTLLSNIAVELWFYCEVLPRLPVRAPRCFGLVEDQEPGLGWLFLEDMGDESYASANEEHRALAAEWLAYLHASASQQGNSNDYLPKRGLDHYHKIIELVREVIGKGLANPALSGTDAITLKTILSHCEVLEEHWQEVKDICDAMKSTIVHGDFSAKNVRVRCGSNGLEIFPLDWDAAGWGIAAPDLSQTDVAVYWSLARHYWPELTLQAVKRLANVGRIFWALEPVTGEAETLASKWLDNVMRKMRAYEAEIAGALEAIRWAYNGN
jgi:hypothetical protein